ncbi:hypothetical protein B0T16DRAFT_110467 [Cercophora newfieldiana]|uniref:DUF7702 domain-containing protein n=1 Tax=Cercophora newfieldiana TaxID=92897 RepID=A0AA40CVL2_9PEZI|nr:hypothetical protein B0T16DRAFT_110467 [Cercophora newfieldiana]
MTISSHTAAAIAQTVLYAPAAPIASYLLIRNWKYRPRTAWYPSAIFSAVRLVGGIMTIIEQQNPRNRGLIIGTIVLLNLGLIPLLMAFLGYARLVIEHDFGKKGRVGIFLRSLKVGILVAAGLLGAAGGYAGQPENANTQTTLSKAAYAIFSIILAIIIASFVVLFLKQSQIKPTHRLYIKWALIASPALCVRAAYGVIGVAVASGANILTSSWSPLFGSATAFGLMGLLPEYIVLCIYIYLSAYHLRTAKREEAIEGRGKLESGDVS